MLRTKHDPKVHGTWRILNLLFDDQTGDSLEILLCGLQWFLQKVLLVVHPENMRRKNIIKMPYLVFTQVPKLCKKLNKCEKLVCGLLSLHSENFILDKNRNIYNSIFIHR